MAPLGISDNNRYIVLDDGRQTPFFWLADTAWELMHRLNREQAEHYLATRAKQRFTVIQAVALAELDGIGTPNAYGDLSLKDADPTKPDEAYFEHVDFIVDRAAAMGLRIAMLPTWGDKLPGVRNPGPPIFNPDNAGVYGEWIGRRYRDKPVIWVIGGDRPVTSDEQYAIWRNLAAGIQRGDGGRHLMTFHPDGTRSSSRYFHDDAWLSFNMLQSGHQGKHVDNYRMIAHDYALSPAKPVLDGEPNYEDHPVMSPKWTWEQGDPWFGPHDVRKSAWRSVLAGACGHTYGCHPVWQMWEPKYPVHNHVRTPWQQAIELDGAYQMQHLRTLMESRPMLQRIPDQSMLIEAPDPGDCARHVRAMRAADGSHAFVYTPTGEALRIDLSKLRGPVAAAWYDPRTGESHPIGRSEPSHRQVFVPPTQGDQADWVLVLDA